jgi:hypothetical protein
MEEARVEQELWIGLVGFRPMPGSDFFRGDAGGFTNVVMWANSEAEYRRKVQTIAAELGLFVTEIEDEEPVTKREQGHFWNEEIEDAVCRARSCPSEIVFGTFHTYKYDKG